MEATAAEASAAAAVASAAAPSQLAYYAVHESAITSALDACVTDTMEKQPADPVLHLGKQLVMSAEKAAGIRRLTLEEAEALLAADTGRQLRPLGFDKHLEGLEDRETKDATVELWRGTSGIILDDGFREHGGTDVSPCSTSDDVQVALNYSKENDHRVIFKIITHGFMERGAPLQWLSAFPGESEFLYPPLTYLKPTGVEETFDIEGVHITALEVVASM